MHNRAGKRQRLHPVDAQGVRLDMMEQTYMSEAYNNNKCRYPRLKD